MDIAAVDLAPLRRGLSCLGRNLALTGDSRSVVYPLEHSGGRSVYQAETPGLGP